MGRVAWRTTRWQLPRATACARCCRAGSTSTQTPQAPRGPRARRSARRERAHDRQPELLLVARAAGLARQPRRYFTVATATRTPRQPAAQPRCVAKDSGACTGPRLHSPGAALLSRRTCTIRPCASGCCERGCERARASRAAVLAAASRSDCVTLHRLPSPSICLPGHANVLSGALARRSRWRYRPSAQPRALCS